MIDYLGQILLIILGLFIELGVPLFFSENSQKKFIRGLGAILLIGAALWFGYSLGENYCFAPVYSNSLITYYDFEGTDNGWSSVDITSVDQDGNSIKVLSDGQGFPGTMVNEITSEYALVGENSLKVTTSVTEQGEYRGYLYRRGSISGHGITIYVMLPIAYGDSINYIQLCIPSNGWVCSDGTHLVPGEWTPIVIDLSQSYEGDDLYTQKLTEIAVQWRFSTESGTSFPLYFDAAEVFHAGTID